MFNKIRGIIIIILLVNCNTQSQPTIAFLDAFKDETLAKARMGFFSGLASKGFSEKNKTLHVVYRNALGDIPMLTQSCDYFISQNVSLIATCPSLSTIAAIQRTKKIPICMMVSPSAKLANLLDAKGDEPANLFGVFETLDYLDTAVNVMIETNPNLKKVGLLYNQSEPQSQRALMHIAQSCKRLNITLIALPSNNSSETQQVVQTLLSKDIQAFFAMPDNTVFASFEVIVKECKQANVPIFTSEAGLFERGANAAFGADMYNWGYQSGLQAASYLKNKILPKPQLVKVRKKFVRGIVSNQHDNATQTNNYFFNAIIFALAFSGICLGLFISINVFNLPDITTDGSYTLGAAITAALLMNKWHIIIVFLIVVLAGAAAGVATAFIHTKLKVNALLSGIITMTALYSINLLIMQQSNIPIIGIKTIFDWSIGRFFILLAIASALILMLHKLLNTDFGIAMRATGNSEQMVRAMGVNTTKMKMIGLALANALTALSGFMVTQYQGFADINMGVGIVIFGLGSVMISNAMLDFLQIHKLFFRLLGVVVGAIIFRLILAIALTIGLDPVLLKLVTAGVVLLVVALPALRKN